jgi:hypothetical protein
MIWRGKCMSQFAKNYLLLAGITTSAGAVLHIAILFGGPDWYAFFGAPQGLVDMARAGNICAPISCLVIAAFLALLAAYAFSGAGLIRHLPHLRLGVGYALAAWAAPNGSFKPWTANETLPSLRSTESEVQDR